MSEENSNTLPPQPSRRGLLAAGAAFALMAGTGAIGLTQRNQWRILLSSSLSDKVIESVHNRLVTNLHAFDIKTVMFAYADAIKQSDNPEDEKTQQQALESVKKVAKDGTLCGIPIAEADVDTIVAAYKQALQEQQQRRR